MSAQITPVQGPFVTPDQFPLPALDLPAGAGPTSAVLAGGCFWCTEAVYKQLDGVTSVMPGYAGGTAETADYEMVCTGRTNHAEAIRITYDPSRTSYGELLRVFFAVAHDPTQKDRQGNDVGRQYRSAIFFSSEDERRVAEAYIRQLGEGRAFAAPIVTTLEPLTAFYEAEAYHHDFAARNPRQGYVRAVALPKVEKLQKYFADRLARPKAD